MMTSMVLINAKKAVYTIEHDLVLQKFYAVGFSKRTVSRFKTELN